MNTNLELYKTFYYVVKNQSITGASNELMISQPAVSKSIKVLESELNTKLLNRNNNGVTLTTSGELIYEKIKNAIELFASAEEDLSNLNEMKFGNLYIGAGNTIMQNYLIPIIKEFHNLYPNINVKVHTLSTPELIKRAKLGLIDIIFTHLPNSIPEEFEVIKIKELHDTLVVNKDSKYKNKTYSKKDIEKLPLILLPKGASNRKNFDKFCLNNNIVINPLMEIGNDVIIKELAQSGLGVGLVAREYVNKELLNKELFELKTSFKFDEKYLCYCVETNRKNNIIIKNFIKLLN